MKIIMLLDNAFYPDIRVYKEAKYLLSKGCSVEIICWDHVIEDINRPATEDYEGIKIRRFRIPYKYNRKLEYLVAFFKFLFQCKKYLTNKSFNYLHAHDLSDAIIAFLIGSHSLPYVFDMHEYYEIGMPSKYRFDHMVIEFLIKKSHASLYENDIYLDSSYSKVATKLYPLKNYPDKNIIYYEHKIPSKEFRIGYHGEVRNQVKEFCALFEAVKDLKDVRVDINGGGKDLEQLKIIAQNYENVFVNGPFDGRDKSVMSNFYKTTDVLYCGYDPNDPNMKYLAEIVKYFEAICTGTPILATETLAVGMRTKKYGFGLAVDTKNPKAIRNAILKLKNDKKMWEYYSNNELLKADEYNWQSVVTILDEIYNL